MEFINLASFCKLFDLVNIKNTGFNALHSELKYLIIGRREKSRIQFYQVI